jgi:hypothetical protein
MVLFPAPLGVLFPAPLGVLFPAPLGVLLPSPLGSYFLLLQLGSYFLLFHLGLVPYSSWGLIPFSTWGLIPYSSWGLTSLLQLGSNFPAPVGGLTSLLLQLGSYFRAPLGVLLVIIGYKNLSQMLCDGCDHIIGNIPKPIRTSKSSPIEPLSVLRRGTTVERVVLHPFCTFCSQAIPPPPDASYLLALNSFPPCLPICLHT